MSLYKRFSGPKTTIIRLLALKIKGAIYIPDQNHVKTSNKRYDLYFGAKILKSYDYSTRYDYSASAGTSKITVIWKSRILCIILERLSAVEEFWVLCNKLRRFLTSSKIIWNSRILCTSRSRIIVPCRMIVPFGVLGSEIQIISFCCRSSWVLAPKDKSYPSHERPAK